MKRKIINIDREKCNGCGLCVQACHEGAIQLVDGKAALISDIYCDGLGDCLPVCPTNAIQIIEREAEQYSDEAVKALKSSSALPCGCPGTMAKKIDREKTGEPITKTAQAAKENEEKPSELSQWPVQLK
jgi:MinD superfamily P-loop ATPase